MDLSRLCYFLTLKKRIFPGINSQMNSVFTPQGFSGGSEGKAAVCNAGDSSLIPGLGRSPGEKIATNSCFLAWRISWTVEPGELQFMGLQRVRHDWATSLHSLIQASVFCKMRSLDKKVLMFSSSLSSTLKCIKLRCLIHFLNFLDRTLCSHCT